MTAELDSSGSRGVLDFLRHEDDAVVTEVVDRHKASRLARGFLLGGAKPVQHAEIMNDSVVPDYMSGVAVDHKPWVVTRGDGQVAAGGAVSVPADEQCLYHCIAASYNVDKYLAMALDGKIKAARFVKTAFIAFLRHKQTSQYDEVADRLDSSGPEAYPTSDDFKFISEFIGGALELSIAYMDWVGPIHHGSNDLPVYLRVLATKSTDGAGHQSDHYELLQSWIAPQPEPPYDLAPHHAAIVTNAARLEKRKMLPGASDHNKHMVWLKNKCAVGLGKLHQQGAMAPSADSSLIGETKALYEDLRQKHPAWEPYRIRLALAALAVHRLKADQMAMTDHLRLLWIMLGGHFLRVHDSHCYYYDQYLGAFKSYSGIFPFQFFTYIRLKCFHLEGLFRAFEGNIKRNGDEVLKEIERILDVVPARVAGLLNELYDNALYSKGNELLRNALAKGKGGKQGGKGDAGKGLIGMVLQHPGIEFAPFEDVGEEESGPVFCWYITVAKSVAKLSSTLQGELLGNKLISLMVEWCESPKEAACGVAYKDFVHLYDQSEGTITPITNRSPDHNIYIGIDRCLFGSGDPCLNAAIDRVWGIYGRTFWANSQALVFCQACLELAKRGQNVDQITIFLGPGGVGLSLYTAHLAAMLGQSLHKYFDPNVFYDDTELRKTIELLFGGICFSGQERPTGNKTSLREDLLKKLQRQRVSVDACHMRS
jgi:hypothetical protein